MNFFDDQSLAQGHRLVAAAGKDQLVLPHWTFQQLTHIEPGTTLVGYGYPSDLADYLRGGR